jgi:hypothetical protein
MTPEGFRAVIRSLGLEPCQPSFEGATLHRSVRTGEFIHVTDPEGLSPDERELMITVVKFRLGISDHS